MHGRRKPGFSSLFALRTTHDEHPDQVTTLLRSSNTLSPSLLPAWGFGAAPATQKASQKRYLVESSAVLAEIITRWPAVPRGERGPSPASLVAFECSLTFVRHSIYFNKIRHSSRGPKVSFFTKINDIQKSNQIQYFLFNYNEKRFSVPKPPSL